MSGKAARSQLHIALGIYRLSPRGGLEDQCIRLAEILKARGHHVTVLTALPAPPLPFETRQLAHSPWPLTNHGRMKRFARDFIAATASNYDRRVGFQPIPGADILFCADPPKKPPRPIFAWCPGAWFPGERSRIQAQLEAGCFGAGASTRIICLSPSQAFAYMARHGTEPGRIALMPPSLSRERRDPERRRPEHRQRLRKEFGLRDDQTAWLWLGLRPKTKGLDRVISALAGSRQTHLLVGGLSKEDRHARRDIARARRLGVADRISWLGYLDTEGLLDAMAIADLLVHPARLDVTGAVIVEALINGLPVVATGECGFAHHVTASGAGRVVDPPFSQDRFSQAIAATLDTGQDCSCRGISYGAKAPLYDGLVTAAELIEAEAWTGLDWRLENEQSLKPVV